MKKFLFIIFCLVITTTLHAQLVSWGVTTKLEERFGAPNQAVIGKYLGQINGADYYTYYSRKPKFVTIEDTRFAFCEVKGTKITKFSPYSDTEYEKLDVSATDSKLCVTYVTGEKKAKRNIKLDYFNPSNFKKTETTTLLSFDPIGKDDPYIDLVRSDNQEYIGIIANGKHPETGQGTIIIKCFNKKYEEIWASYYDYNGNGYPEIGDFFVSNTGTVLIHFLKYESEKKKRLESFYFVKISDENINELEYSIDKKVELVEYKIGEYKENQYLMAYTEKENVTGLKIDFSNESISQIFSKPLYEGNWRIDKIVDMQNGNFTIAMQNRDLLVVITRGANNTVNHSYNYWNRSFVFIGINGENDELTYLKTLGRYYGYTQGIPTAELNITIEPFYFVKDGDLHVVYNTDKKTKDFQSNSKEKPGYFSISFKATTVKPITKMATISESGDIKTKTLFDSKVEKGVFFSKFSHLDENNDLIIAKGKKKTLLTCTL